MTSTKLSKRLEQQQLFDLYGGLLTKRQSIYFSEYIHHDLSMQEIADKHQVTKSSIHQHIKTCNKIFQRFENKLQLLKKQQFRLKLYEKISDLELQKQLIKLG